MGLAVSKDSGKIELGVMSIDDSPIKPDLFAAISTSRGITKVPGAISTITSTPLELGLSAVILPTATPRYLTGVPICIPWALENSTANL